MTHKPKTIGDIASKVTVKITPKIEVENDYEAINEKIQLLYANTATLLTPQGGGYYYHIGIIMKPTLYTILSTTAWTNPPDPVVYLMVTINATAYQKDQLHLHHD